MQVNILNVRLLLNSLSHLAGAKLSLVLISRLAWSCGPYETDTLKAKQPIQISFPAYEPAALAHVQDSN